MEDTTWEILFQRNPFPAPMVTVVTTVYDRVNCLARCLGTVARLTFKDLEQIVVSDGPPVVIRDQIKAVSKASKVPLLTYANLKTRTNNYGVGPTEVGMQLAKGKYVAFLSDDNGYFPNHFEPLVTFLEANPEVGFVYCSCFYNRSTILCSPKLTPGDIDLGQALFRRDVLQEDLGFKVPVFTHGWDYEMMKYLHEKGVAYKHIDNLTFIFRLAQYPELLM